MPTANWLVLMATVALPLICAMLEEQGKIFDLRLAHT
jgi:hypothetical protein